jgi:putative transposase
LNVLSILDIPTIRKSSTNKWYASIVVNISRPDPFPKTGQIVGLDLGLKTFIQTSDGFKIPRKRFFNTDQHDLAQVQRQLEKYTKGSKEREQIKKKIAHIHERIANRRKDFCHKSALDLVKKYDFIVIEDLNTKKMLEQKKFSKSISDVAWTQLRQNLSYKAEEAGKKVVAVNPRNTSQMCSTCGTIVPKDLNIRIHHCPVCGLKIDRDLNASLNILRLGMQSVEYRAYASLRQEHG